MEEDEEEDDNNEDEDELAALTTAAPDAAAEVAASATLVEVISRVCRLPMGPVEAVPAIGGICSFKGCVGGTEEGVSAAGVTAPARLTIGVFVGIVGATSGIDAGTPV